MSTRILAALLAVSVLCVLIQAFDLDTRVDAWLRRRNGSLCWLAAFTLYAAINVWGASCLS
jgi:hypothetical protein